MLKGNRRILWSTLTVQKSLGGEGRNMQQSMPSFTAQDRCVSTCPCPRAKPSQTAAKSVSTRDKTCWTPALLSEWHTGEVANRLPIIPRGHLTTPALLPLLLILWLLSALKSVSLLARKGWMLLEVAGGPVLPAGAAAPVTPFPSSAVRVLVTKIEGDLRAPASPVQSSFNPFPCCSPVCGKAGESWQSHERSNSSSQPQKAHQTFLMLPSSCSCCYWLYQELNRAILQSRTQASITTPSSMDVPMHIG